MRSIRLVSMYLLVFVGLAVSALVLAPTTTATDVPEDWLSRVQKNIAAHEYHVTWQDRHTRSGYQAAWHAPNRAHGFRTYFTAQGIHVGPRDDQQSPWELNLSLVGYGRGDKAWPLTEASLSPTENRVDYLRGDVEEWYVNSPYGLKQGFILSTPPEDVAEWNGSESLVETCTPPDRRREVPRENLIFLDLALTGNLSPDISDDGQAIDFTSPGGGRVARYAELKVTDATGRVVPAWMEGYSGHERRGIRLVMDIREADYPLTVDPLLTTEGWSIESDQANARLAASVATAGDVDGDGDADVIVGAPGYDRGQSGEGMAFVYYGSPTGLDYDGGGSGCPADADWCAESNQANAGFGGSVATAGDVDGDGDADVIVGAPNYDNGHSNEGMAFVYYGTPTGLDYDGGGSGCPAGADWCAESDQIDAWFSNSVATAGDVDGDGYSDVIVGAYGYDNGLSDEGMAFVYYGTPTGLDNSDGGSGCPADADWCADSGQALAWFSQAAVGTAGDVNGDGYSDIIIGARFYDNGETDEGMTFVYYGTSTGLNHDDSLSGCPADADWCAESDQGASDFGLAVATAGDVNGDGFTDIIIGAPGYDHPELGEGMAFVYYGTASGLNHDDGGSGCPVNADWCAEGGPQTGVKLGASVGPAGDVNGDGYADVIVGSPWYDNVQVNEGMAFVFYGTSSGLDLDGGGSGCPVGADWCAEGDQEWAEFGSAVATAGDVDGDGYADVIIGAQLYDNVEAEEGKAWVYHGAPAGLAASAGWTAEGNQTDAKLGYSVATAGDVNGDGFADVIVGAYLYDNGQTDEGIAYLYHGSDVGLETTPVWSAEGDQANAYFGLPVAAAGDVDGDGYADVVVLASAYDNGETDEGMAFVYHGTPTGLDHDDSASGCPADADWCAESDLAVGRLAGGGTAGDVNGDGYADLILGAFGYDGGETDEGIALVYHGSGIGLDHYDQGSGCLADADWCVESDQANSSFGQSVATAGDIDGDGFSDVIVGAFRFDNVEADEGWVFVYYGSPTGLDHDDMLSGCPADADWCTESDQAGAQLGRSVGMAGDVNGDGYADVVTGAYLYDNGQSDEGQALVFYGSTNGLDHDDSMSGCPADADWCAESDQVGGWMGFSVSTAGDVDGDGYADVIVCAYGYAGPEVREGRALVYHGSAAGLETSPGWTAESDQVHALFGYSVSTAGDVNGDGYADVIVGAPQFDNGPSNEGWVFVYYGNDGPGLALRPQQRRSDDAAPIVAPGWSDSRTSFRLAALGRTPFGRGRVKLEWEVKPFGTAFDGTGTGRSTTWSDTGTAGVSLNEVISGLTVGENYHWRARLLYEPSGSPFQQASRWFTVPRNGWEETDLGTPLESSLSVSQTDVDPILATNGTLEYFVSVANSGPDSAEGTIVNDTLPAGSTFVSATPSQGTCAESGGEVTCSLGTLSSGGGATIDIVATISAPGVYTNLASISSRARDPNLTDNSSSEDTTAQETLIGGLVWEDQDGDGIQDALEPNLGGILVELLDDTGTPVDLTLTVSDGSYSFPVPVAAVYRVRFDVPTGWILTTPDQGADDTLDSDADVFSGETVNIGPVFEAADANRWSAGLRRIGPCIAPDEPIFIATLRIVGTATVIDFLDGNQPEQVTGYNVYRSSDAGIPVDQWPLIASDVVDMDTTTGNLQWFDDTGDVSPTGVWYYKVAAYNSACAAEGPR